jgi:HEAT repeat protein
MLETWRLNRCVRKLGNHDWRVRLAYTQALGRLRDPRAVGPLIRALGAVVRARHLAANVPGDFPNPQLELLILLPVAV